MALAPGTRLGPYEVLTLLGAGGMGEVYRAHDSALNRDVAIKVLPASVSGDPEHLARFQREAQLLAALNHPHIAHIYGLEGLDGRTQALVMELVDGLTLADRLAQGPIPLGDTLTLARQIAEALEAAHDKGIIHRDLKPANVKVTVEGTVKVLDFGLAKAFDVTPAGTGMMTNSPTLSMQATQAGVILGTAAYMAPEQATGHAVDRRADVWAFGVVLWEMLTGTTLFAGETISHTLAFVITKEPDWNTLPANTPVPIRRLLRRALEKDRKRRLPDIGSARLEIDEALVAPATESNAASVTVPAPSRSGWYTTTPWALVAALSAGLAMALAMWAPWRKPSVPSPVRLSAEIGVDVTLGGPPGGNLAISPDGKLLVFVAQRGTGPSQLYIRRTDQLEAIVLAGTDGGRYPFFSPDGLRVGFFAAGTLKKMSITGGAAVTLCDTAGGRGGTWGDDGTIVFTPSAGAGLMRVSDSGGRPEQISTLVDGEGGQRWPQLLPGKAVLFSSAASYTGGNNDEGNIVVQVFPDGPRKIVQRGGYYGRVAGRHLLYVHGGTLFAVPFDVDRLEIAGVPVPVNGPVEGTPGTGADFAVSDTGTLVYLAGQGVGTRAPMVWLDRTGKTVPLRTTPAEWSNPSFSRDGTRLAMDIAPAGGSPAVWVYDWMRDTPRRLTVGASPNIHPVWTPDENRIVFGSSRGSSSGATNLYWQRTDGTGDAQRLTESPLTQLPGSWHPKGKALAFTEGSAQTGLHIKILTVEGDDASGWKYGMPTPFLDIQAADPQFSPDGRWIAYTSIVSGKNEIYVTSYPSGEGRPQISTDGGISPIWSRTRPELFYLTLDEQIMVASYTAEGSSFKANKAQAWWSGRILRRPRQSPYALHPDGNRFALATAPDTATKQDHVVFVFNFFDELRRLTSPVK